ncbi:MAG: HEAT repeat domain-containing protein, partial [Candidatus Lindowbacteria bacterium]|nr:HEAT repeat domain-containing protein [Candidatus Lindowbacteria bacterium]
MKHMKRIALPILILPILLVIGLSSRSSSRNERIEDLEYALTSDDPAVRIGAIAALTEYGDAAVPSLRKALKDADENVKKTAVIALGKIGGQRAADALADTLVDPDRTTRVRGIIALSMTGRPGLSHLFRAVESEPFPRARLFAAHGITKLVGPGDAPEIMKRFERQDSATKMHLVIALVKIGDDESYASLNRLMDSPNRLVRFYVASTISEAPADRRSIPILTKAVRDEAQEVRMWSMYALEQLSAPETYPVVLAALNDNDAYVRKEAAYTLGSLGNRAAMPHLISSLKDPYYLVRCDSADSLGRLGDPKAIPVLRPLLAEDNEALQIKAAEALARLNDYSGMEILVSIVDSPVYLYKVEATQALRRISNKDFGEDRQ